MPDELRHEVLSGFGESGNGEDKFDALVGLLGMLRAVRGVDPCEAPGDEVVRKVEGWIMARPVDGPVQDAQHVMG